VLQLESDLIGKTRAFDTEEGMRAFLSGHDDRQPEIDALTARVRELEATLLDEHSRLAQAEAQPAAVGVVGAVRWGCLEELYRTFRVFDTRESAQRAVEVGARHGKGDEFYRVVAIVDPAQIVPLASATPAHWEVRMSGGYAVTYDNAKDAQRFADSPVTPLYPGIAQPAQEREG
jgi:hypothetical protein